MGYIDDSFYTEDTFHRCQEDTLYAVELFIKLGFVVHPTKSVFQPTQSLEFLDFALDSILMRVTITEVKVVKILALCRPFLANRSFTIRHVASLIGTLVFPRTYHINVLELLAGELGLRSLLADSKGNTYGLSQTTRLQ